MKDVLKRPTAEETDDYLEYKRLQSKYKALHLKTLSSRKLLDTYETDSEASGMVPMARSSSELSEEEAALIFVRPTIWSELEEVSPRRTATRYQPRSPSDNRGSEATMSAGTASPGIDEVAKGSELPVVARKDYPASMGHKTKEERKDSGYFQSSTFGLSEALRKL